MEHIIARLLRDFENGFMNRRQLIQSLALAATAATASNEAFAQNPANAPAAGTPAAARPPAFKTVELDHISYQVKDYRVTRDFYADLMGMDVALDDGKTQCELHFGNSMIIARNHFRRQGAGGAAASTPPAAPATAGGRPAPTSLVDHIAYRIYSWDTDKVREELVRRGLATPTSRPDTGGGADYSSFHVRDPDGYNLQISGWAGPDDSVNKKKP